MTYNYYHKCSVCTKNVGHYCDGCEVRIDCILHEASKLNIDYEHLKAINDELRKQVGENLVDSTLPDEEKIKVGFLRTKIRSIRDTIIKNRESIQILEQEVNDYSNIDVEIEWVLDQIQKLRAMNEIRNFDQPNIDIPVNVNIGE